jgi:hypothetical protein
MKSGYGREEVSAVFKVMGKEEGEQSDFSTLWKKHCSSRR